MSKINEIIIVLAAIVTIISGIIGYKNLVCIKNLFKKILKSIMGSIIKNFNWLLVKYFKIIWKIIGMEKRFEEENDRLEIKFEEIKKQFEVLKNPFYHYLKGKYPSDSTLNVKISIKSITFKKTETGYECNSNDYEKHYNKIERFDESGFEIIALGYSLKVQYKELDDWTFDGDGKINLYLNRAVVLCEKQKLKLEDFNKIWCYCCLGK